MPRSGSKPRDHGRPTGQRVDIHSVAYVKLFVGFSHRELIAFAKIYPLITGPREARDEVLSWSLLREDGWRLLLWAGTSVPACVQYCA